MKKAVLVALVFCGCATPLSQLKEELGTRSSDALKCPEDELKYEDLEKLFSTVRTKVTGCGRSVTWKMVESRWTRERER